MDDVKLMGKFIWCELLAPFFGTLGIILVLPVLLPVVCIGLGCVALRDKWDEFKRVEAASVTHGVPAAPKTVDGGM